MPKPCKRRRSPIAPARTPNGESLNIDELDELQRGLLELLIVRFRAFLAKFGREPEEEEPLFFDVSRHRPEPASPEEMRQQTIEAAKLAGADARLLLRFFGIDEPPSSLH